MSTRLSSLAVLFSGLTPLAQAAQVTVSDAYFSALKKNETISINQSRLDQAEELRTQARGAVLPNISAKASYTRSDDAGVSSAVVNDRLVKLTLTQPIFHGMGEYSAFSSARLQRDARAATLNYSKAVLFADVTAAFNNALSTNHDVETYSRLLELTTKRAEEMRQRNKIGRSRRAEVYAAEAQLAVTQSQLQQARASATTAKLQFTFVTGLDQDISLREDIVTLPETLEPVETFLKTADDRGDLRALRLALDDARESVTIARSGHFPSLDLTGNYYPQRDGTLRDVDWDVGVTLQIPIFSGGITQSKVDQASLHVFESELAYRQAQRQAEEEVRNHYSTYLSLKTQLKSLREAVVASENNYREQNKDYKYGLGTNLDVIQAMNGFYEAQLGFARAEYLTRTEWERLLVASNRIQIPQGSPP